MITPNLANRLGATGPIVKYFLTTCRGRREEKPGRRISGVVLRSLTGIMARLPQIFECANIPEDKREIATPEMARQFSHLKEIADEILPYDPKVSVGILIGRDAPELLKIRARRNEPKGASWAQKLDLGWTISGQMCLDRVRWSSPYLSTRHIIGAFRQACYQLPPGTCKFHIITLKKVSKPFRGQRKICRERRNRSQPLSIDTRRQFGQQEEDKCFLKIMEPGTRKNQQGNWEMPLPFPSPTASMPNNRPLAVNRLNGLIRTLNRKPKMKQDYFQFMGKVFKCGHAVPVP